MWDTSSSLSLPDIRRYITGCSRCAPVKMRTQTRQVEDVAIVDVRGRITAGEGNVMLREVVLQLL
jgi:hypothetical protein